jgi:transcriptional regulator with XRE-family HTH domain
MTPDQRQEFARRLRSARERRGLNQADLARALRVGQSRVSEAERLGTSLVKRIDHVAKLLKVDPAWLLWGDGPDPWETVSESVDGAGSKQSGTPTLRDVQRSLDKIAKRLRQSQPTPEQSALADDLTVLANALKGVIG